jgi:hypothetical protein
MSSANTTPFIALGKSANVYDLFSKRGNMQNVERRQYPIGTCAYSTKWSTDYVVTSEEVNEYGEQASISIKRNDQGDEVLHFDRARILEPGEEFGICIVRDVDKLLTAAEVAELTARTLKAEEERRNAREQAKKEREEAIARGREVAARLIPPGAKGLIMAEQEIDDSDPYSDYYNTKTVDAHVLAVAMHLKDLFPEMRKAAARFENTKHLADADKSAEHREKYSMGAGYYLGSRTGWRVHKVPFWSGAISDDALALIGRGKHSLDAPPQAPEVEAVKVDGVTVRENEERDGVEIIFPAKPSEEVRERMKALGFRWSRPQGLWYAKRTAERLAFAKSLA